MDGEANGIEAERFYRDEPNRSTERCVSNYDFFYPEAGPVDGGPVLLLLHGYPPLPTCSGI